MRLKPPPKIPFARWTPTLAALPALCIHQPFAWLLANGIKDVENRSWTTKKRGLILLHAGKNHSRMTVEDYDWCQNKCGIRIPDVLDLGGVVGVAELVDCVRTHPSKWKERGCWGWVFKNARPLPFRECQGAMQLFYPKW